jgi:nitrogen PTS system EIIA component
MELTGYLTSDRIIPELLSCDKEGVLGELAAAVEKADPRLSRESVLAALRERENLGSTGIGDGIAIPHARFSDAADIVLIFARSRHGVPFDSLDGREVHFFFLLIAPEEAAERHLKMLARISRLLSDPSLRRRISRAAGSGEMIDILLEGETRR